MKDILSTMRMFGIGLWHFAVVAFGIVILAVWIAVLRIEQLLGHLPPIIVAALPEKYHGVLLAIARLRYGQKTAVDQKEE